MVVAGIGFSSHYVLPWSMAPDTIEYGYARSGVRREGIYYSVWTFCDRPGRCVGRIPGRSGPGPVRLCAGCGPIGASVLGIRLLIGPLPAVLILLGNLALAFYPLNQMKYDEIQAAIAAKQVDKP